MGNIELLDLKNDIVFQELFGKQKNSKITEHLLTLILEREIKNIDLDVNKRMLGERQDSKTGRLDIRAKFNDGEDVNIELQIKPYEEVEKRLLDYWANMYLQKIDRGDKYTVLKPSIVILITNYKLKELEGIEKYHTIWNLREKEYSNRVLTKDIEIHILEMPKVKETEKGELALWLRFIENSGIEGVQEEMEGNKYLKQAMEELEYLSDDPEFRFILKSREMFLRDQDVYKNMARKEGLAEGRAEGLKKGLTEGIEEGQKKEKIKIAKNMLKEKFSIEQIERLTGLTEEEIRKIN